MSKQEQIEELKKKLVEAHANNEQWRREARRLENEKNAKVALDKFAKRCRETTEILDLLKLGYVKVETLRNIIRAEYNTESHPSIDITDFTLRLRSTDRVEDALRAAILVKPKPKFATGGYTGGGRDVVGVIHHGEPVLSAADLGTLWPACRARGRVFWDGNL